MNSTAIRRAYQVVIVLGGTIGVLWLCLAVRSSGSVAGKVPVVDASTGNRLTNANAHYLGYQGYPIVSNFAFLPASMRSRTKFEVEVRDGFLYVPRRFKGNPKGNVQIRVAANGYLSEGYSVIATDPERFLKLTTGICMVRTNDPFHYLQLPRGATLRRAE